MELPGPHSPPPSEQRPPEEDTTGVFEHYERQLGPVYAWMVGDFEEAANRMTQFFDEVGVKPFSSRIAVDLGSGHGVQAVPLARRGLDVIAIDRCGWLLESLRRRATAGELPIHTIEDDLRAFTPHLPFAADAFVCMGDTLTHLANTQEVAALIQAISTALNRGGMLCLSFRDLTQTPPTGAARFIPIRADETRILTTFLDYGPHTVTLYDQLYQRDDGQWRYSVGSYAKLRLSPAEVVETAKAAQLRLTHESERDGLKYLAFRRR